jgi:hypothetical protein
VVETLGVSEGGELYEVPIPLTVASQEDEVVIGAMTRAAAGSISTVSRRNVRLHTDNRLELLFPRQLLKLPGTKEASMIGERKRGHLKMERPFHQIVEPIGSV